MKFKYIRRLQPGDIIYFNDHYVNRDMFVIDHSYKVHILHTVIEDGFIYGVFVKRWLVRSCRWSYEFFSNDKLELKCTFDKQF